MSESNKLVGISQKLGFFMIDKPKGLESFGVVRFLRKTLNMKRIGYAGTLDPLASGLMIVAVGEATKLLNYLEKLDKVYEVELKLGFTSETFDSEGPLEKMNFQGSISRSAIEKVLEEHFLGERNQTPPAYSAIQIEGKRAYALARKGIQVELEPRKVHFFEISVKHYLWPKLVLSVHCSSGTYIRSFVHDLGQLLGCGAYVSELRRTKIGHFSIQKAVSLENITSQNFPKFLLKPQEFLSDWLQFEPNEKDYEILANGGFIPNPAGFSKGPILALCKDQCVGILETTGEGRQLKFLKKFNIV
jgi:tRNA pseudouridine55 synthase